MSTEIIHNTNVITYSEYCSALGISEATTEPNWFFLAQKRALKIIRRCLAQSHLFPSSREMLQCLKPQFTTSVITAIAEQIKYCYENETVFEMAYMGTANFSVGGYSQGRFDGATIHRILHTVCPLAWAEFEDLGWNYQSLQYKLPMSDYYIKSEAHYAGKTPW